LNFPFDEEESVKVFWFQAGLHFEPETKEEQKALALLLGAIKVVDLKDSAVGSSVFGEQPLKVIATNS
jgi:hypothetical protein